MKGAWHRSASLSLCSPQIRGSGTELPPPMLQGLTKQRQVSLSLLPADKLQKGAWPQRIKHQPCAFRGGRGGGGPGSRRCLRDSRLKALPWQEQLSLPRDHQERSGAGGHLGRATPAACGPGWEGERSPMPLYSGPQFLYNPCPITGVMRRNSNLGRRVGNLSP